MIDADIDRLTAVEHSVDTAFAALEAWFEDVEAGRVLCSLGSVATNSVDVVEADQVDSYGIDLDFDVSAHSNLAITPPEVWRPSRTRR